MGLNDIPKTPEGLRKAIQRLRDDFEAHNHDGTNSKSFQTIVVQTISGEVISIRKTAYGDPANGLWAGIVNNVMEFILGNSTNFVSWDGTTLTITGMIVGSSIYIPNAINPLFSVDSSGNAIVNSLQRNDFHWFSLFESIDGYATSAAGTGLVTLGSTGVTVATGNITNNISELQKNTFDASPTYFTWDKKRKLKTQVNFPTVSNQTFYICCGSGQNGSDRKLGFMLFGNTLYGVIGDGSSRTLTNNTITVSSNDIKTLEAIWTPGVSAAFYVNGVLLDTITTGLPSGVTLANWFIDIWGQTSENVAKSIKLLYWDFWQSN